MDDAEIERIRQRYIDVLKPLFFPDDPVGNDILKYFASLLRVVGMEDKGWDPYLESRNVLEDLNGLMSIPLPLEKFQNENLTRWRIGFLFYAHIVEMDALYEVITNLLRFKLGKGYSPNSYHAFLPEKKEKKKGKKKGDKLYPKDKIEIIKQLSLEARLGVGQLFDEFYNSKLRNAISHSDYILTEDDFRCRNGTGSVGAFKISLVEVNQLITKAKIFVSTFFSLEREARRFWGTFKNRAVPYDLYYKGLMEVLADKDGLMCGFKVHWPNGSESCYRRTEEGCEMNNCMLGKNLDVELWVDLSARNPGSFSPLVEKDQQSRYSILEGTGEVPVWSEAKVAE